MFKSIFVFGTLILLLFGSNLKATTYYVDDAAGNDGNSGKTILLPWKTLAKVNGYSFASGDIVSFKCGGRFSGTTISGKSNITFNSYGSGPRPVIDGQGARNCFSFDGQTNIIFNGLKIVNGGGGDIRQNIGLWNTSHVLVESCNIDSSRGANIHNVGIYAGGGSAYLTVRNSTLSFGEQTSGAGNLGIYIDGCDNTLMEYDTLDGNFSGIRVAMGGSSLDTSDHSANWTDNLVVRYCVIKNGKWDGIDDDGSFNAMYYYNLFVNNYIEVYQFTNGDSQWQAYSAMYAHYYNNTFVHSGSGGIFEYTPPSDISGQVISTGLTCRNNIFYNSGSNMMYHPWGTPAKKFTFNNNIWYGSSYKWDINNTTTTSFSIWQGWGYDANGATVNPLFTNYAAGDYTLQSGSPGLNTGTNVGLTVDIHGNPVPQSSPDMGAFQHVSAAPTATTYYVANNGNDANSGTSISLPWKSISKVNSKVFNPGDNILFRRGDTWSEILTPQGSGNATSPIVYDAYGSGNLPIIDGGTTRNNCISVISVNYITIRNFRLQYAAVNTNGDIHAQGTDNLRIENCDFYITSHGGVFIESSTNGYIGNCTMSSPISNNDNQADGIYSQRNSSCVFENNSIVISDIGAGHNDGIQSYLDANMTFRNNYIYQNNSLTTAQGIDMSDGAGTFYVYNNVIKCPNSNGNIIGFNNNVSGTGALRCYQNTVLGNVNCLKVLKCTDVTVKNNIFYSNSATSIIDIGSTLTSGSAIDYNLYNRSGSGSIVLYEPQGYMTYSQWQTLGFETHGINANPVVDDTLYPATNSPVINIGTNLGGIFSVDKEGTLRPVNGVDLGAYELKSALPVELTSFSGTYAKNSVRLNWITATEINNQGFDIERNNNSSWVKIGFIEGKGNSVIKNEYSFEDKNPVGYKIQYRLKQIDNNGDFSYSNTIEINASPKDFTIGNYPNPFNPSTKIRYSIPAESMINLVVYNVIGERLDELKNEVQQPGSYELNWSGNGHPSGVYFVSITESPTNGGTKNSKTIKMNLIK